MKKKNAQAIKFTVQFSVNRVAEFVSGQFESKKKMHKSIYSMALLC